VTANVLSVDSVAQGLADQHASIDQGIVGNSTANGIQDSGIDQGAGGTGATGGLDSPAMTAPADSGATTSSLDGATTPQDALSGPLLNVNVDVNGNADLAAPIDGAVAANANVAAPIDGAVSANIGSIGSESTAVAQQDAVIQQNIDGDTSATADQTSSINQ
jgi:hypothetical protein